MAAPQDILYTDLTLETAERLMAETDDLTTFNLLHELSTRVMSIRAEQDRFREWCDRADQLYYADNYTRGGADLWADDPNVNIAGRAHVSVNTPPAYVDIPAALQAVTPEENILANSPEKEAREAAVKMGRLYEAWKRQVNYETMFHKACVVKGLYGRTAGKVYWDPDDKHPKVELIEQPRNLYMGYQSDNYEAVEWVAYVQRVDPHVVMSRFGVDVVARDWQGSVIPFVQTYTLGAIPARPWLYFGAVRIEVWDYWFRRPAPGQQGPGPVKMQTWNVVLAGNCVVRPPTLYKEYEGKVPFIPLLNTFVPGTPEGRADLYDMEQLIREKYTRITAGAQMIAGGVAGDYWQLTGPDAPSRVNPALKPRRNEVVAPGPGNRIETITPFIAQFQLEQYLGRLDREMAIVSGINDLLLGLSPQQVLSSSKAINALIANYETRISMRRQLLYAWRKEVWRLAAKVWALKDPTVKKMKAAGAGDLEVIAPSLAPVDDLETSSRAANLLNAKLWSQRRAMSAVGVDDPETEQELIRLERTDATLFPADVQVMAQLLAALQSLGLQPSQQTQQQAGATLTRGESDLRNALGAATPEGIPGAQPTVQGQTPPEAQSQGGAPFAQPPAAQFPGEPQGGGPSAATPMGVIQNRITGGKDNSRFYNQIQLGRR